MNWTLPNVKTYLVVALAVVVAVLESVIGIDIPGIDVSQDWLGIILAAAGLGGLRAAIGKAQ